MRQVLSQVRCRVVMVIPTFDKEQAMTPNYLQFQPGLSLNEFLRDYGTQAQCQAALEKARWPAGYLCPACQSGSHCIVWHGKVKTFQCNRCHTQVTLTAGTIFTLPNCPWSVVSGYVLSDPDEKQRLRPGAEAPYRGLLSHGLAAQAQVDPGHARTRREHGPEQPGRS